MTRPTPNPLSLGIAHALAPHYLASHIAASRARQEYSGDKAASVDQPCRPAHGLPRRGGVTGPDAATERDNLSRGNRQPSWLRRLIAWLTSWAR